MPVSSVLPTTFDNNASNARVADVNFKLPAQAHTIWGGFGRDVELELAENEKTGELDRGTCLVELANL